MKVENTKIERKQDEINVKVNLMKVKQGCLLFIVDFYHVGLRLREVTWVEIPPLNLQSFLPEYS